MKLAFLNILLLISLYSKAQTQDNKVIVLDSVSAVYNSISICGQDHYHPVDIKAKLIFDSLKNAGIDTLVIFRHWFGMNGFNGYGKVVWLDKGVLKQYRINFINRFPYYGIKSIDFIVMKSDSVFNFYFRNILSSIKTKLSRKSSFWMSHDSNYFVYLEAKDEIFCYDIDGLLFRDNPEDLRSIFINQLEIDSYKYFDEVYGPE